VVGRRGLNTGLDCQPHVSENCPACTAGPAGQGPGARPVARQASPTGGFGPCFR